jgi:hypothetical protein
MNVIVKNKKKVKHKEGNKVNIQHFKKESRQLN